MWGGQAVLEARPELAMCVHQLHRHAVTASTRSSWNLEPNRGFRDHFSSSEVTASFLLFSRAKAGNLGPGLVGHPLTSTSRPAVCLSAFHPRTRLPAGSLGSFLSTEVIGDNCQVTRNQVWPGAPGAVCHLRKGEVGIVGGALTGGRAFTVGLHPRPCWVA